MDSFRVSRWVRTFNLILQAILFVTFFFGLNYLARNHAGRFDLTQHRRFSLSPETLAYIKNVQRPIEIVATIPPDRDNPEIRGLLNEYVHATEKNPLSKITVKYLDVYQNRRDSERLNIEQPNILVLRSGENRRVLLVEDLYRLENKKRVGFTGEQTLTAALLDVSNPERQRIYFLVGHGELTPTDVDAINGLSTLGSQLGFRNFKVDTLDLAINRKVPTDASLLVAVAPQSRYTPAQQELLRQYLGRDAGRILLFLAPGIKASALGIEDLLLDWGVLVDDDVICDLGPQNVTEDGDLVLTAYADKHPITQTMISNELKLRLGPSRSVSPDPGRSLGNGLNTIPLAATSTTAWGERDYLSRSEPRFDRGIDISPRPGMEPQNRLGVVVASERLAVRDNLPFSVRGGRLVVFGTRDMIANGRIAMEGNLNFFLGAVNWTVDRDHYLNIAARPIEHFQISLSTSEFTRLRYTLMLALPGAALLLGGVVYWTRRT